VSDPEILMLRGRLSEVTEKMARAEAAVRNACDTLRKAVVLYRTPDEIDPDCLRAAVEDLIEERANWIALRDERNSLRSRLGMD